MVLGDLQKPGMTLYGIVSPLPTAARPIVVSASGSWPTLVGEHGQRFIAELTDPQVRSGLIQGPSGTCPDGCSWWSSEPGMC